MWLWTTLAIAAAPLEIRVDPTIRTITLSCDGQELTSPVRDGVATFDRAPENCTVLATSAIGELSGRGVYQCKSGKCSFVDVVHRPIQRANGRINVVLAEGTESRMLELKCAGDHRDRTTVTEYVGTFDNVPKGECTLMFKGGSPAQFRPVIAGTDYRCQVYGVTAVCEPYTPR